MIHFSTPLWSVLNYWSQFPGLTSAFVAFVKTPASTRLMTFPLSNTQVNRCVPARGTHVLRTTTSALLIGQQSNPNRWPSAARAQRSSQPQQAAMKASAARWRPRSALKLSKLLPELDDLPVTLVHGPSHLCQVVSELVLDRVASSVRRRSHRRRRRRPQRSSRSPTAARCQVGRVKP